MMRRFGSLRRKIMRLANRFRPAALILIYHRIAELSLDPFGMAVAPRFFEEHLRVLREQARPIPLRQLVDSLHRGTVPPNAVVVTFDDGYVDNLHAAKPLLEKSEIPATVYIASGHIGQDRGFWWDELESLLLRPGMLPWRLSLNLDGRLYQDDLGAAASYGEADHLRHSRWTYEDEGTPSPRHRLFRVLYPRLRSLSHEGRSLALQALRDWAGSRPTPRPGDRTLTEDELVQLGVGPLIEVGAHTHHHAMLSSLPAPLQRQEVEVGKTWLEERLGRSIADFSYPHGEFTAETAAIVRDAGFASACSTHHSAVRRGADLYRLPRVCPGNCDGEQFARSLHEWFSE